MHRPLEIMSIKAFSLTITLLLYTKREGYYRHIRSADDLGSA
jgi:hypothetical protein